MGKYKIKIGSIEFIAEVEPMEEPAEEITEVEPIAETPVEEPVEIEPVEEPSEEIAVDYVLLVHLGEDPIENRDVLNRALLRGDVTIDDPGVYPIAPGVVIDGRTLDLGGAQLIGSVTPLYNGAYIELRGQSPRIRNGRFSGHYSAAPGEPGYNRVEFYGIGIETAIGLPIGCFTDALIEGMTFDHVSGYVICPRGTPRNRRAAAKSPTANGWQRFTLTPGCPLIAARHGIDYGTFISSEPVLYAFHAADGAVIETCHGIPGEAISVPDGAVEVGVLTSGNYVQYVLDEYEYDNSLTIDGCIFKCNQRLGIANLPGISVVRDCISISNGYPREDHTGITWDCSTTGFLDIEDVQSPELTVIRCTSENENLGIASRAYELLVDECRCPVSVYGGWNANIYDHVGRVGHSSDDVKTEIMVYESNLQGMSGAHIGPNFVLTNSTIDLSSALNKIKGFNCVIGEDYVRSGCIYLDDVVVGTISGKDGWFELATKEGSDLLIRVEADELAVRAAVSDCWGLDSNLLVLPNGHTIHKSRFVLDTPRMYKPMGPSTATAAFDGVYDGCKFEVTTDAPFTARAVRFDAPITLVFRECDFGIDDGLTLIKGPQNGLIKGTTIRFESCTLNGRLMTQESANRIVAHDLTGIGVVVS